MIGTPAPLVSPIPEELIEDLRARCRAALGSGVYRGQFVPGDGETVFARDQVSR